jgi:hypothetical protein
VPSTVIRRYEYVASRQELLVTFQTGRRYRYRQVPAETYAAMKSAYSKGTFFNTQIRDRFPYVREE